MQLGAGQRYARMLGMSMCFSIHTKIGEMKLRLPDDARRAWRLGTGTLTNIITLFRCLLAIRSIEWRLTLAGFFILPVHRIVKVLRQQMRLRAEMRTRLYNPTEGCVFRYALDLRDIQLDSL